MKWAEELKNEYSKIAKINQLSGLNNQPSFGQHCPNDNIEVSKKISEDLDIGQTTLKKAQYIYNNASEEMIKQLDEGQLSINKAYNDLKGKLKQEQRSGNFPWLKEGNNWRM